MGGDSQVLEPSSSKPAPSIPQSYLPRASNYLNHPETRINLQTVEVKTNSKILGQTRTDVWVLEASRLSDKDAQQRSKILREVKGKSQTPVKSNNSRSVQNEHRDHSVSKNEESDGGNCGDDGYEIYEVRLSSAAASTVGKHARGGFGGDAAYAHVEGGGNYNNMHRGPAPRQTTQNRAQPAPQQQNQRSNNYLRASELEITDQKFVNRVLMDVPASAQWSWGQQPNTGRQRQPGNPPPGVTGYMDKLGDILDPSLELILRTTEDPLMLTSLCRLPLRVPAQVKSTTPKTNEKRHAKTPQMVALPARRHAHEAVAEM